MSHASTSTNSAQLRPPTRLQKRAPSSVQVPPAGEWKVAIPLLSPLAISPPSSPTFSSLVDGTKSDVRQSEGPSRAERRSHGEKMQMWRWENPASPFFYKPARSAQIFLPQCT